MTVASPTRSRGPQNAEEPLFPPPPSTPEYYPGDPACSGGACGAVQGKAHPWCHYELENSLGTPSYGDKVRNGGLPGLPDKHGKAGSDSLISFSFDPDLRGDFDAGAKAGGVFAPTLSASANFEASAIFNLGLAGGKVDLLKAESRVSATRCEAYSELTLRVFGIDMIEVLDAAGKLDRSKLNLNVEVPWGKEQCEQAFATYDEVADRAKKALRDAQELIRQYKALPTGTQFEAKQFCEQVTANAPTWFPPGNCSTDSVEKTINRFVEYYYRALNGYWAGDVQLMAGLAGAKSNLSSYAVAAEYEAPVASDSTRWQVAQAQFFLGPVPMTMQLDAVVGYGLTASFSARANGNLPDDGNPAELAWVNVSATPDVSAGVELYVGAGFSAGPFEASAGVDGSITLGDLNLPSHASAGLMVSSEPDPRLMADGSTPQVAFPYVGPRRYHAALKYDFGSRATLREVLHGTLNASVRVEFLWFSKRWKQQLVEFAGLGTIFDKELFGAEGEGGLGDTADWGLVEMPAPFVSLAALPEAATPPTAPASFASFDPTAVERLFYGQQCTCAEAGQDCSGGTRCCDPSKVCTEVQGTNGIILSTWQCLDPVPECPGSNACSSNEDCTGWLVCGGGGCCEPPVIR